MSEQSRGMHRYSLNRLSCKILVGTLVALSLLSAPLDARAEEKKKPADVDLVILVVDVPAILSRSKAAKDIKQQLEDQRKEYQEQIAKREEELKGAQQEIEKQRTILSPEAFEQKQKEFRQQLAEVQKGVQQRKAALESAFTSSMNDLRKNVVAVVAKIAKEDSATLVLSNQQVVLVDTALDITDRVLKDLDEKMPSAKITVPELPAN